MNNLKSKYDQLFEDSISKIAAGEIGIDRKIASDDRFGITLIARPDFHTRAHISAFLSDLKSVDGNQYFYPNSDMHITVLSLISGKAGFNLSEINLADYVTLVRESVKNVPKFEIELKGVTASAEAILVQGFPSNNNLETIRENLRTNFKSSGLQQSIDTRYKISTAHVTAVRFASELKNPSEFAKVISAYREHCFGKFTVDKLELVCNDWYQKAQKTTLISTFDLA